MEVVKFGANSSKPYKGPKPKVEEMVEEGTNEILSHIHHVLESFRSQMPLVKPLAASEPSTGPLEPTAPETPKRPKWRGKKGKLPYGITENFQAVPEGDN